MTDCEHYNQNDKSIELARKKMSVFKNKYFITEPDNVYQQRRPGLLKVINFIKRFVFSFNFILD